MKKIMYLSFLISILVLANSCDDKSNSSFDEDQGLNVDFPEALFEFSFEYVGLRQGQEIGNIDSVLAPTPKNPYSFASFDAVSNVHNDNGIRYVESTLIQGLHGSEEDENGEVYWSDKSEFIIKLNVSTTGDAVDGEPYDKEVLLEFLKEDQYYPTNKDQLGAIELMYKRDNLWSGDNDGLTMYIGIDEYENIGDSGYEVKVVKIEDHEDRTREGELIKEALKVTIEFEGIIGLSNHPSLDEGATADQWTVRNGKASFLIDYSQ